MRRRFATISARPRLLGQARAFFETELVGIYGWDSIALDEAQEVDRLEGGAVDRTAGKFKELVTIRFGDYALTVASPAEKPPIGWISLSREKSHVCSGTLDQQTWIHIGNSIKGDKS